MTIPQRLSTLAQEHICKPLTGTDSIRLIELQPPALVRFRSRNSVAPDLLHVLIDDLRDIFSRYAELSYVLRCTDKAETIWVDEALLMIKANLFSALRDLRDGTRSF
jgi:hypothetical protein